MKNLFVILAAFLFAIPSIAADAAPQVIEVQVTENGFEPSKIDIKVDAPVVLKVTRKTDSTCATELVMKEKKIKKELPLNQTVSIELGKLKKGDHSFSCSMNMIKGNLLVN